MSYRSDLKTVEESVAKILEVVSLGVAYSLDAVDI